MSMQPGDRPGEAVAKTEHGAAPRDLADLLWGGFPLGDLGWPFREMGAPAGVPIRVEEVMENDQVVVRAELPGLDPEKDIDVTVDEGVLTIRAERRESTEDKTGRGYRSEFRYGTFVRQIRLPRGTSTEVVSASYRDVVLEVRLPAPSEGSSRRRIQVERG
jgi:HSP20 family protein